MERDVAAALLLLCSPVGYLAHLICFHRREGKRDVAQQMQGCSLGPSAAAPESLQQPVLGLAVPQVEHNYDLQGE